MPRTALRVPEEKLAHAGALGAAVAAVLASGVAGLVATGSDAVGTAAGALLVGLLALAAIPLYRVGSAAPNGAIVAVHLAALGLRLVLGVAIFAALARLTEVPMTAFAAGIGVGLVASIIAEMVAASRDPRFFWVTATPTSTTPHTAPLSSSGTERQHA